MNNVLIYIGDDLIDLYPDIVIATSIKSIDIGELSSRYITHTNSFKVPSTENNMQIFGFPFSEESTSSLPYTLLGAKYVSNGLEIMRDAVILISDATKDNFSVSLYENIFDFFNTINGKTLRDFTPIAASAWDAAAVDAARVNTSGIVSAIIHYVKSNVNAYTAGFFLPSFYYKTLVESVLESTGLTLEGDIFSDTRYTELIVPYFRDEFIYPEDFFLQFNFSQVKGSATVVTDAVNNEITAFSFVISGSSHGTIRAFFSIGGVTWNGGTNLVGRIKQNGSTVASVNVVVNPAPGGTQSVSFEGFFNDGDTVTVVVYSDDMASPGTDYTIAGNSEVTYIADGIVNTDEVEWSQLLIDLPAEDLLKDFLNRFGLIQKQVNNKFIFKGIDDIISDKHLALDWSEKLSTKENVNVSPKFAQQNLFTYNDLVGDDTLGLGSIDIDNSKLELKKDIFKTSFGNAFTKLIDNRTIAQIPVYVSASADISDFDESPGLRLLTIRDNVTGIEPSITFDATPRSAYKIGYFLDNSQSKDTGWEYFLGQFYVNYGSSLQRSKVVTKFYNLTEIDIIEYDPHKLVYDGNYYLVNKIDKFIPGRLTKVELFKVL